MTRESRAVGELDLGRGGRDVGEDLLVDDADALDHRVVRIGVPQAATADADGDEVAAVLEIELEEIFPPEVVPDVGGLEDVVGGVGDVIGREQDPGIALIRAPPAVAQGVAPRIPADLDPGVSTEDQGAGRNGRRAAGLEIDVVRRPRSRAGALQGRHVGSVPFEDIDRARSAARPARRHRGSSRFRCAQPRARPGRPARRHRTAAARRRWRARGIRSPRSPRARARAGRSDCRRRKSCRRRSSSSRGRARPRRSREACGPPSPGGR